jgi:hypothetical protein
MHSNGDRGHEFRILGVAEENFGISGFQELGIFLFACQEVALM